MPTGSRQSRLLPWRSPYTNKKPWTRARINSLRVHDVYKGMSHADKFAAEPLTVAAFAVYKQKTKGPCKSKLSPDPLFLLVHGSLLAHAGDGT